MRALITGASHGIGGAICSRLARDAVLRGEVARIAICATGRRPDIGELAADLERLGAQVLSLFGDLAELSVPDRFIGETVKAFGGLDAVVSNAGVTSPASLLDLAVDDWD